MTLRRLGVALLFFVGLAVSVRAQGLAWKFPKGATFYVEAATTTKQTIDTGGKPQNSVSTVTTVSRFEVVDLVANSTVLRQTIEGVRVKTDDPTGPTAMRAANVLKGAEFTVTLASSGKVLKFEGYDGVLRKLTGGNPTSERLFRNNIPEEALKEELNTIFGFLPDQPPAVGASWQRAENVLLGPLGSLGGTAQYTYQGPGEGGEQIRLTRTLSYVPPKDPLGAVKVGTVKIQEATGTITFDSTRGRLAQQQLEVKLQGTVVMTQDMKPMTLNVQQTSTRTFRVVDKNPLDTK